MHATSATSATAHKAIRPYKPTQRDRILTFIKGNPLMTREEIALHNDMKLSSVCGRVSELIQMHKVKENGRRQGAHQLEAI